MPRSRNIKPGFFANDELAECDPLARIVFIGLWCLADREGRLEDRPKKIRGFVFPYENYDVNELLNQLQSHGFILRYEVNGSKYIQVINFKKHQKPHPREAASVIPAPPQYVETNIQTIKDEQDEDYEPCLDVEQEDEENVNSIESREKALPGREKVLPGNGNSRTSPSDILIPDILNADILNVDILNADMRNVDKDIRPSANEKTVGSCVREPPTQPKTPSRRQILSEAQLEKFNQFWYEYPKKKAKFAAMKAWAKLKPDEALFDDIMMGLRKARASVEWKREGGRFIPHPATFLNQGRWEDEYLPSEQKPTKRDLQNMSVEEYVEAITGDPMNRIWDIIDEGGDKNETG